MSEFVRMFMGMFVVLRVFGARMREFVHMSMGTFVVLSASGLRRAIVV
jgi:hypothetical protein